MKENVFKLNTCFFHESYFASQEFIMKSLDPLRAKKIFIRKKLGHTAVSAILKSLISDPIGLTKGARGKYCKFAIFNMAVVSKTDISRNISKYFKFV